MKKLFAIILIGALSVSLFGCQKQTEKISSSYLEESEPEVAEEIKEPVSNSSIVVSEEHDEVKLESSADISANKGVELRTDLNGDGVEDKVYVEDIRSGNEAYTQLTAIVGDVVVTKNYVGYYDSYLVTEDLSGNGKEDVLLVRCDTGSTYGAVEISLLYYTDGEWKEYPKNFIHNTDITLAQPDIFGDAENWYDLERYIGATVFLKEGKPMVRFIALLEDSDQDTVKIIEVTYRDEGWYIENIEIVDDYYTENKDEILLNLK